MLAYELATKGGDMVRLNADDAYATIKTKDGKEIKMEFPYGDGYLGNSSRTLKYQKENTLEIRITNFKGETRTLELSDSI